MMPRAWCRTVLTVAALLAGAASAPRSAAARDGGGVPDFDVKQSCQEARKFGSLTEKSSDYRGCLRDEEGARRQLDAIWSSFKPDQKRECLDGGPDPSYVELLTCLQLDVSMTIDGQVVPQVGGAVAPGLGTVTTK